MTDEVMLDLDAASDEPEKEPFTFRFGGEVYTCRPPEALDVREIPRIVAAANEDPSVLLEVMLSPDELARLDAADDVFDLGMLNKVRSAYDAHYGMDAPKASGSRKSSRPKRIR